MTLLDDRGNLPPFRSIYLFLPSGAPFVVDTSRFFLASPLFREEEKGEGVVLANVIFSFARACNQRDEKLIWQFFDSNYISRANR